MLWGIKREGTGLLTRGKQATTKGIGSWFTFSFVPVNDHSYCSLLAHLPFLDRPAKYPKPTSFTVDDKSDGPDCLKEHFCH